MLEWSFRLVIYGKKLSYQSVFFVHGFFSHVFVIGRYTLDVDLKAVVTAEKLEATASRVEARKVGAVNISYAIVILKIIYFHLSCLATGRIA